MPLPAFAQASADYPNRPVRFIVPFPPGGTTDFLGRALAEQLGRLLGQQFVVDNKGGAGGNLGVDILAKAAPDGYTLGMINVASHAINPTLYAKLPFDPLKDFAPISMIATLPNLLVAHPSVPAASVPELIALARGEPGKYTFASSGAGTTLHLSGEMFNTMAGIKLLHVPYKGGGPALQDLLAGVVHMIFGNMPTVFPQAKAGKVRALAVTSAQRNKAAPDVPTIGETLPGYVADSWQGFAAPSGTPPAIVAKLVEAARRVLTMPDIVAQFEAQGATAMPTTPGEFVTYMAADAARWAPVVKASGARVE
ncbi:MAG TPA: tripartite tricarboxylate transporter substrate binding protein [Vineibacter sp.]|nr:tripartite tricarboxylate transporter substrate binding protein [Vineibacter sp.]